MLGQKSPHLQKKVDGDFCFLVYNSFFLLFFYIFWTKFPASGEVFIVLRIDDFTKKSKFQVLKKFVIRFYKH